MTTLCFNVLFVNISEDVELRFHTDSFVSNTSSNLSDPCSQLDKIITKLSPGFRNWWKTDVMSWEALWNMGFPTLVPLGRDFLFWPLHFTWNIKNMLLHEDSEACDMG